jgi:hypothetical protein
MKGDVMKDITPIARLALLLLVLEVAGLLTASIALNYSESSRAAMAQLVP